MVNKDKVIEVLKRVIDPELGINIVDLGLIYGVDIEDNKVKIKMTMTVPGCPLADMMVMGAEREIRNLEGVEDVEVELVFDPPWTPQRMSEDLRKRFGV